MARKVCSSELIHLQPFALACIHEPNWIGRSIIQSARWIVASLLANGAVRWLCSSASKHWPTDSIDGSIDHELSRALVGIFNCDLMNDSIITSPGHGPPVFVCLLGQWHIRTHLHTPNV